MSPPRRDMGPHASWEAGMSFVAGPLIGYFMDKWLDTGPWCLVGFTVLGAAAGFRRLFSLLRPMPPSDGDDGAAS